MNETIHTALFDIARDGDDCIQLSDGLSLIRPNEQLLNSRWDWVQGQGEMEEEAKATRYLVCEYPSWVPDEEIYVSRQRRENRFYAGLMAIQIIKPIRTHGFVYRHQQIERRPSMEPGTWARINRFDDSMLAQLPALIDRIQSAMNGANDEWKNALTLLQLGLEHFHPYIAGLLWVSGLEAIFDSGGREPFKDKLCNCLGASTLAFPNWHSLPNAPTFTVEDIAIHLYTLRNKFAHGASLRTAMNDEKHPVDFTAKVNVTRDGEDVNYALLLCEAACYLLSQVLQKVL